MRKRHEPASIHEDLAAIEQRVVKAKQTAREAELDYRAGQEAIAKADQAHLDAQAAKAAGQTSDVDAAANELERAKAEALSMRELEIARRAVELAEQERVAFLANNTGAFEQHFAEQYSKAARRVQDSEEAIVAAYALWQEANRQHFAFRHAIGASSNDIPQTPPELRDSSKAIRLARESRAAA